MRSITYRYSQICTVICVIPPGLCIESVFFYTFFPNKVLFYIKSQHNIAQPSESMCLWCSLLPASIMGVDTRRVIAREKIIKENWEETEFEVMYRNCVSLCRSGQWVSEVSRGGPYIWNGRWGPWRRSGLWLFFDYHKEANVIGTRELKNYCDI